ncbi:MAG: hypothetical protein LBJ18_02260 [Rickettsiales bacterium]|jgi:hypothetical protein|nr:hypothetical protein [Rickettsiales bacterium]
MQKLFLLAVSCSLLIFPAHSADRSDASGAATASRVSVTAARAAPTMTVNLSPKSSSLGAVSVNPILPSDNGTEKKEEPAPEPAKPENCRDAYRDCMDQFCLMPEEKGLRCACSAEIEKTAKLVAEITTIQSAAEKMYTLDVEKAALGENTAKAREIMKDVAPVQSSYTSIFDNDEDDDAEEFGKDSEQGAALYALAAESCKAKLEACGDSKTMEETLYSREITKDCGTFKDYLADQKRNAEANKQAAEKAVRVARTGAYDTYNKYNAGDCLLMYRSCIADKGGCGPNFENCIDAALLDRRAEACDNILDMCVASKPRTLTLWETEKKKILADADKFADRFRRQSCDARVQMCLEDTCSPSTNPMCLTNFSIALGSCPVITECDNLLTPDDNSYRKYWETSKFPFLRVQFCQNDVAKCFQAKCGMDYTSPDCVGKSVSEIKAYCKQDSPDLSLSCAKETKQRFNEIVTATLWNIDLKLMAGCVNKFSEILAQTWGTDMSRLPADAYVASLTVDSRPKNQEEIEKLRNETQANAEKAAGKAIDDLKKNTVILAACKDSTKPEGTASLATNIFSTAETIAKINAGTRALRELELKLVELGRADSLEQKRKNCEETTYVPDCKDHKKDEEAYTCITSSKFEPDLSNCHVCRIQRGFEEGGEDANTSGLKSAAGMAAAGASAGTMITPGIGTAIGAAGGLLGGFFMGKAGSDGKKKFPFEVTSCEDVNM